MNNPLSRLRLRLTLWYAGVFTLILALLGAGLYEAIHHLVARQLDASLRAATVALIQAAGVREVERASARGTVVDAVEELHIPDRSLYLLDADGRPITPATVPQWVQDAARQAAQTGGADRDFTTPTSHEVRLHAERFAGASGRVYVGAAVADRLELDDQYSYLIAAFAGAALGAVLLMVGGGYVLVRQSTAPIEQSMNHMRRFMADAAHELRTPIAILRTQAEVALTRPRESERDRTAFQAIERETARVGRIVGDLLTLARADAGERPIVREPLYLDDAAAEAVDAVRTLAEYKQIQIEVGTFEEAKITGDAALVRQLLLIVLDNAIKYTPKGGGGRVRLDVSAQNGTGAVVVTDTGVGIAADHLPLVFERFYRAEPARRDAEGAGLGLAIARWIADAHGGRIDIASQPGTGTRVTVTFPLAP